MNVRACLTLLCLATPAAAWDGERFVVCNLGPDGAAEAVLRAGPAAQAAKVMTVAPGTHLEAEHPDPQNGWRQVIVQDSPDTISYSGPMGWAHTQFLCNAYR
jgi:hypothetical protein